MKVLVSSCLMGIPCRWHGKPVPYSSFLKKHRETNPDDIFIGVCPEMLGGLPCPRPPVKRRKGKVFETCAKKTNRKNVTGAEVTQFFIDGAGKTLEIAREHKIKKAFLCNWSPSCDKSGITGKLLILNGIEVVNIW